MIKDQGAFFLVAADLGVSFENDQTAQFSIKDLCIGISDQLNLLLKLTKGQPINSN